MFASRGDTFMKSKYIGCRPTGDASRKEKVILDEEINGKGGVTFTRVKLWRKEIENSSNMYKYNILKVIKKISCSITFIYVYTKYDINIDYIFSELHIQNVFEIFKEIKLKM